jgi:hypothetical protein
VLRWVGYLKTLSPVENTAVDHARAGLKQAVFRNRRSRQISIVR